MMTPRGGALRGPGTSASTGTRCPGWDISHLAHPGPGLSSDRQAELHRRQGGPTLPVQVGVLVEEVKRQQFVYKTKGCKWKEPWSLGLFLQEGSPELRGGVWPGEPRGCGGQGGEDRGGPRGQETRVALAGHHSPGFSSAMSCSA